MKGDTKFTRNETLTTLSKKPSKYVFYQTDFFLVKKILTRKL